MLESLAEEFRDELRRCGWEMNDELVLSAVSVYLKARIRKIDELNTETSKEREKRLEKKREWNRQWRKNGKLRDVGAEVFGGHGGADSVADDPEPPRSASPVAQSPWSSLDRRRELIEKLAEKNRRNDKYR